MKKKWLISSGILALIGGSIYFTKKIFKKTKSKESTQREEILKIFERQSFNVYCYNENNDFLLFNPQKNEKRHIIYDDGKIEQKDVFTKLNAYYYHFTDEFYFIAKDEEVLYRKTKIDFTEWIMEELGGFENLKKKITVHFTTFDKFEELEDKAWETIQL